MRNQKGITLVALVITIIVLLILAAVTIAALGGSNGILTNASNAQVQNELGEAKDLIKLAINEGINEYYTSTYVNGSAENASLNYTINGTNTTVANNVKSHVLAKIDAAKSQITAHGTALLYVTSGTTSSTTLPADASTVTKIQIVSQNRKAAEEATIESDGTLGKWLNLKPIPTVPGA